VHPEPTRFSKKRKKHPFAKIIEKAPFHYTDIQWPHDQRDQAGGKTWEGKLAVCGRKPLYALAKTGPPYHLTIHINKLKSILKNIYRKYLSIL
jgi:hypothetical protein